MWRRVVAWATMRIPAMLLGACLAQAPLQGASEPEEATRPYDEPGEALLSLAEAFRQQGDEKAWRQTLEHLIATYPNSRYSQRASQKLGSGSAE